jgi:hypothetical protein
VPGDILPGIHRPCTGSLSRCIGRPSGWPRGES